MSRPCATLCRQIVRSHPLITHVQCNPAVRKRNNAENKISLPEVIWRFTALLLTAQILPPRESIILFTVRVFLEGIGVEEWPFTLPLPIYAVDMIAIAYVTLLPQTSDQHEFTVNTWEQQRKGQAASSPCELLTFRFPLLSCLGRISNQTPL